MMDPIAEFEIFVYGIKDKYPDIKHHRVPASGIGFTLTNLPFLIEEIINQLINS